MKLLIDGSTDYTVGQSDQLLTEKNRQNLLCLNRNFVKEATINDRLNKVKNSDAIIVMDSDLKHSPPLFAEMNRLWQEYG